MQTPLLKFISAQGDYIWLVLGTLMLLGAVDFSIRRFRSPARLRWPVWVCALLVLAIGWERTQSAGDHARLEIEELVSSLAPTYAYELEQMGHSQITLDTPPDDQVYLRLIQAQIKWEKLNPFAHDIYTFRKRPDGTNVLVVDSETDYDKNGDFNGKTESRTPIGKVYPQPLSGLEQAYQGTANFDQEVYDDDWGSWVSAFVPMRGADGKVEAVLGVDFDAQTWLTAIAKNRRGMIWIIALVLAAVISGGAVIGLLRADIARRIEFEQQLQKADERMQLVIRQMPFGYIEFDADARVLAWNTAAEKIFSYPATEVLGRAMLPLIVAPAAREHVDQVWSSLLQNKGGPFSKNENITKDGRTIICEWFNTPLVEAGGRVIGAFSLFQDVTSRIRSEKQLRQSERLSAIGQLAAGVAHDFNNILTIITGHAGLLLAQNNLLAEQRPDLQQIENAAMRASSLTRQLLAFSRQQAMFPRPVRLGDIITHTAAMLGRVLSAEVNFKTEIALEVPLVEADAAMIEQVITNLVLNARDALAGNGNITITLNAVTVSKAATKENPAAQPGLAVCLTVSDTGVGIPAEQLPHIFEPFFTTKPTGHGTGLGLSVVHGIVEQHHGWITVDSSSGQGTTFRVYFPPTTREASNEPTVPVSFKTKPSASNETGTILLAEDEGMVRDLCQKILESAGYRVLAAGDGPQALSLWKQHRDEIDLLLTDMVMPNGLTGLKLCNELRADRPELPVIYTSGYSLELTASGFCESDHMVFLPKPFQSEQLLAAVRHCLKTSYNSASLPHGAHDERSYQRS